MLAGCAAVLAALAVSPGLAQEGNEAPLAMSADLGSDRAGAATVTGLVSASASEVEASEAPMPAGTAVESRAGAMEPMLRPPPAVTLTLTADLTAQRLTVLEGAEVKHVWPISSGRRGYATPAGTFRPTWMARMWYSRQYDASPMPHSVFFNNGIAFHATSAVGLLGRPASHGCIRLAPANAAQLYALVRSHGLIHTKVVVHGAPRFEEPAVARRGLPASSAQAALGRQRGTARVSPYGRPLAATQWFFVQ
jgi:hypothetical protein